ncbi:MAG: hypothetical protein GY855_05260 [candidate division Zixibacteria bacterium]|nr:hypothetical protein [candidate division Zixibacteria bacterium]
MADSLYTSNSKIKYLLKLARFFIILIFLDFIIGQGLRYLYFHQNSGGCYNTTYSIEKTSEDIIVIGASRAAHHYIPKIFADILGYSCYNAGLDGQSIVYQKAVLSGILSRYKPKLIILDTAEAGLFREFNNYNALSVLLPYYSSHKDIQPLLELKSNFEKYKLLSGIYPFNGMILRIVKNNLTPEKRIDGYAPLYGFMKKDEANPMPPSLNIDTDAIHTLETFLASCNNAGVRVVGIISPVYTKDAMANDQRSFELTKEIFKKHGVPLWDYSDDGIISTRPELFADIGHLNHKGAQIYTREIVSRINEELSIAIPDNITDSEIPVQ